MMGGEIRIDSALGKGALFSFTVPVEAVAGMTRSVPDLASLRVALCASPGPFRDEFLRLAQCWQLPLIVDSNPGGLAGESCEIAFVELSLEQAAQLRGQACG